MGAIPPWPPIVPRTLVGGAGFRHDSAAMCSDGRIVYVYVDGNNIYQSHYPTLEAFEKAANSSATTPVEFHALLDSTLNLPRTTVWRRPGGGLYLFAVYRTSQPAAWGQVWSSPSGDGESAPGVPDWTLHGTIVGPVTASFVDIGFAAYVGEPYITGSRWVLPAFYPPTWDNNLQGIWTSDDSGVTWTLRMTVGYYSGGHYGYGQSRNIVAHAGALWMGTNGNVEGPKGGYSTDAGSTWTEYAVPGGTNSGAANPIVAQGGVAWRIFNSIFVASQAPFLQVGTDYAGSGWTTVADLTAMDGYANPNGAILQHLATSHDVLLWDGHILVGRGGWGIGQVRIA